jgi:signal transduction histidine kinase/ActR/RegA family two-component response regulator/HAMP domain-containing protein
MKFRTRLTLAVALLIILIISVEFYFNHLSVSRTDKLDAIKNLKLASLQVTNSIDLLLHEVTRETAVVARSAFLNETGRSSESINRRLNDFRKGSDTIDRFTFLDSDGTVAADSDDPAARGKRLYSSAWSRGMAGESGFTTQFQQQVALGSLLFYMPVRQETTDRPKGVIIALIRAEHFMELLTGFHYHHTADPQTVHVELSDENGRLLCTTDSSAPSIQPANPITPAANQQAVFDTDHSLTILTPAPELSSRTGSTWHLRVKAPKDHIYAEVRTRLEQNIMALALLFLAGCGIIFLLARRFCKPLEEIAEAVRRRGKGDADALAQLPDRHDEFKLLQQSLQEMSARLHEHTERLTLSEERFHALFDNMGEGVALHRLLYRQDGGPDNYLLVDVNQSYQSILGLSREQVLGRLATELYPGEEPPFLERFAEVVATGCSCSFDAYFAPLDRHFSISACRIGADGFATIFSDITAKKWHEETLRNTMAQLKSANESKSRFLAVMSHEIRTPLNGISGMVQLLRDMEMPPLQREFLDNIDSSAESLLNVINDILDFSKIEAGRMDLEELPFEPCTLLNNTLRVLRLRAQAKGLLLSLVCDKQLAPVLEGDPHRLGQVLTNLVNNAIKFTVGGEIVVTAATETLDQETVRLTVTVSDPGIGMDETTQQTIFDPFIQADSSTTRKYGGAGLGLAICRQLMELMQGSISVSSRPGQGSTFTFSAPLKRGVLPQAPETPPVPAATLDQPLRILVAEDQPVNQRFVSEILRKQGHTTLLANNGQEAVELWQREQVDLVLMDIQMPVMDGLKALAAIRAAEDGQKRHTPIVALTAHAIVGDRERLLHAGFDGYLPKPLQAAALFVEMARVFEQIAKERRL